MLPAQERRSARACVCSPTLELRSSLHPPSPNILLSAPKTFLKNPPQQSLSLRLPGLPFPVCARNKHGWRFLKIHKSTKSELQGYDVYMSTLRPAGPRVKNRSRFKRPRSCPPLPGTSPARARCSPRMFPSTLARSPPGTWSPCPCNRA